MEVGLPNIEGKALFRTGINEGGETIGKRQIGALKGVPREDGNAVWWNALAHEGNTAKYTLDSLYFNAKDSNSIYGSSSTVQPASIVLVAQIKTNR